MNSCLFSKNIQGTDDWWCLRENNYGVVQPIPITSDICHECSLKVTGSPGELVEVKKRKPTKENMKMWENTIGSLMEAIKKEELCVKMEDEQLKILSRKINELNASRECRFHKIVGLNSAINAIKREMEISA